MYSVSEGTLRVRQYAHCLVDQLRNALKEALSSTDVQETFEIVGVRHAFKRGDGVPRLRAMPINAALHQPRSAGRFKMWTASGAYDDIECRVRKC